MHRPGDGGRGPAQPAARLDPRDLDRVCRRADVAPGPRKGTPAASPALASSAAIVALPPRPPAHRAVSAEAGPVFPPPSAVGAGRTPESEKSFRGGECPGGLEEGPPAGWRTIRSTRRPSASPGASRAIYCGETGSLSSPPIFRLVSRILSSYQTSLPTPSSFALRQNLLTDARISSADLTHL